jgi:hypothetical protein
MFYKFNKSIFLTFLAVYFLLAIFGYIFGMALDDGRPMPRVFQLIAYTFVVLRYPTWFIFLDSNLPVFLFFLGLAVNSALYAILTERVIFILRKAMKRTSGEEAR